MVDDDAKSTDSIPEYTYAEESNREQTRRGVEVDGKIETCNLVLIEPYKRVMSHGGYDKKGRAIMVFAACHLPDGHHPDHEEILDHLFLWIMHQLDGLVTDDYVLVYLHGGALSKNLPGVLWMKRCYGQIERRFKKDLKQLIILHPTFWVKMTVNMTRPFISHKFYEKIVFVNHIDALRELVPGDRIEFPELVLEVDKKVPRSDVTGRYKVDESEAGLLATSKSAVNLDAPMTSATAVVPDDGAAVTQSV